MSEKAILQLGAAEERSAVVLCACRKKALLTVGKTEVYIVADEKIQPAVVVVVHKSGADTPVCIVSTGYFRGIRECAATVVAPRLLVAHDVRDGRKLRALRVCRRIRCALQVPAAWIVAIAAPERA